MWVVYVDEGSALWKSSDKAFLESLCAHLKTEVTDIEFTIEPYEE